MRRIVFGLVLLTLISHWALPSSASAGPRDPWHLVGWAESSRSAPWLRTDCYDDDHTFVRTYAGWLNAGDTFTYTTPMPICNSKILRGFVWAAKRDQARLTITDWYSDTHPGRLQDLGKGRIGWAACNSDNKTDIQIMLEDEIEAPASWSLTADTSGYYRFEIVMNEPWWQGLESTLGYCLTAGSVVY